RIHCSQVSTLFPYTTLFRSSVRSQRQSPSVAEPLALRRSTAGVRAPGPNRVARFLWREAIRRPLPHGLLHWRYVLAHAPEPLSRSAEHTSELQSPDHLVCRL